MYTPIIHHSHIGFAVRDIAKAKQWFAELLGFNTVLPPGITKMKLMEHKGYRCMIANQNGVVLELEQRTDCPFPKNTDAIISHFSLEVENIQALEKHLRSKNVLHENDQLISHDQVRILYFTGIDGVRIELIEYCK